MTVALEAAYEIHPQAAVRPEPFGALVYHYGTRRLVFLRKPEMVSVVRGLSEHGTVAETLASCGIIGLIVRIRHDKHRHTCPQNLRCCPDSALMHDRTRTRKKFAVRCVIKPDSFRIQTFRRFVKNPVKHYGSFV